MTGKSRLRDRNRFDRTDPTATAIGLELLCPIHCIGLGVTLCIISAGHHQPGYSHCDRPSVEDNMRTQNVVAVLAAIASLSMPVAQAQLDRPVVPPTLSQPSNSRDCPPSVGNNGRSSNETTGSGASSDQLSQSKGVICPPAGIDPGISVPPIGGGGRTPVIPPPGTPSGDPNVQPK